MNNSQCTPQNCSGTPFSLANTYDLLGDMTTSTNGAGLTLTNGYNAGARLTSVASSLSDSNHPGTLFSAGHFNAAGSLLSASLGNGINETRTYDGRLRLTGITDGSVYTVTIPTSGGYAPNGDILAANDGVNGNWTYGYDAFNRLTAASATGQAYTYAYDRFGNRWQQNGPHSSLPPGFDANNRIVSGSGVTYDAAGDTTNDGSTQYTFDAEGRIATAVNSSSGISTYVYDAEGRRVRKTTVAGGTVDFLYDLAGREVAQFTSAGGWTRGEVYAGGRHLATYVNSPMTYFVYSDWLGTERVRSPYVAGTTETCTSLPFGDWLTCTGSDVSPMHLTGKERDSESGLDNFGARYDSSSMGRFMSPDPLAGHTEDPQTLSRYAYVRNNPLSLSDPTGLDFYILCRKRSHTCQKDAQGELVQGQFEEDENNNPIFQPTIITSASLHDPNSGNTGTVDENGVRITTKDADGKKSTAEGIFINKTPAADLQGSGKLSDFEFHIDSSNEKIGTLDAGSYTYEGSRNQADVIKVLTDRGAFSYPGENSIGNPWHPGDFNFRFSSGAHPELFDSGPSPHILVPEDPKATVPVGPGYTGDFHVDSHTGAVRHGACASWLHVGCE